MKRALLTILALGLLSPLAGASEWHGDREPTVEDELHVAQQHYHAGTNYTARGMFREAGVEIGEGTKNANLHLRELEKRAAIAAPLQGYIDQFQAIRDRFENDWTNAVVEALALEEPITAFATNAVFQKKLDRPLKTFERIRKELERGAEMDCRVELRNFQDALRRQTWTFEELRRLEPDFRAVLADLTQAQRSLDREENKPLDAERALGIAREYTDAALAKINGPGQGFVEAIWDIACAYTYVRDVRKTGELEEAVAELEATLEEAKHQREVAAGRYYLKEAQGFLERGNLNRARISLRNLEAVLPLLEKDPIFDELSELAGELKAEVEQGIEDREEVRARASIATCRKQLGDPEAPVIPDVLCAPEGETEEEIKRFAAETDFAAILKREFSATEFEYLVYRREGATFSFHNDTNFMQTVRSAMLRAVNTNYPTTFPDGERFTIVISPPVGTYKSYPYYPRTRTVDGRTVNEVFPHRRLLHLARTLAQPDDLFLYFERETDALFTPGGRTAVIPGLGAYFKEKIPTDWQVKREPKPHFKGQGERKPAPSQPVVGKPAPPRKSYREEFAEMDIAGNIRAGLDDPFVRLSVFRNGEEEGFDIPTNDWNEVFATLRKTVETKFPDDLSGGERFRLLLVLSETEKFISWTERKEDGSEVHHYKPGVRFVDLIRFPSNKDDAYLDFLGPYSKLFEPGGKTGIVPGFGAVMDRILPPASAPSAD